MLTNLKNFDPDGVYTADDIAVELGLHRTTVHTRIFPVVRTQMIGRHKSTTGDQIIKYLRGETQDPRQAA